MDCFKKKRMSFLAPNLSGFIEVQESQIPRNRQDSGSARALACWRRCPTVANFLGLHQYLVPAGTHGKACFGEGAKTSTRGRVRSPDVSVISVPRITQSVFNSGWHC
jgi:hypothetical protein